MTDATIAYGIGEPVMVYAVPDWPPQPQPMVPQQPVCPMPYVPEGRLGQIEERLAQLERLYAKSREAEETLEQLRPLLAKLIEVCGGRVEWPEVDSDEK